MVQNTGNEFIENLALALIYLSSWKEGEAGTEVQRAWKGYDFNILDKLKEKGFINFSNSAKSLYVTVDGVKKAEEAVEKFKTMTKT